MLSRSVSFRVPSIFNSFANLISAESTRHGGHSQLPFSSLNLGLNTADNPQHVQANRNLFFSQFGIAPTQVAFSHQVHGDQVLVATQAGHYTGYDALITNSAGLFLSVTVADCTPILIYDAGQQAVAAIHAGWRGTVAQIAVKTIQAMQQTFGTNPRNCYAYIGTCIDDCSFEVGSEVAAEFEDQFKRYDSDKQKYCIDLKNANAAQLMTMGLPKSQIEISPYSTVLHNQDYFSYRLEHGQTGRMLALIGLKSNSLNK
ncbi:peptidoglycan editing factor PgeF [Tellurirhabdus bombi]|uniref:peptidoglycan editing factor PgeF n=1 Tax=Tellurirhabdus bombi TaxID=2907205 RepID=UPI001F3713F1|nr:peptidoglycan editing factor PgeF [Tellurirhabdus bombi]